MKKDRTVSKIVPAKGVTDGGGIPLRRTLGGNRLPILDPFLLLDELKSATQGDVDAGMPHHPHRGVETITYVLDGAMQVSDSLGRRAIVRAGSVHWTVAASGVIHDEMPVRGESLRAVQLWLNMPHVDKMGRPSSDVLEPEDFPVSKLRAGGTVRVIAGHSRGLTGPVSGGAVRPTLLDVVLPRGGGVLLDIPPEKVAMVYTLEGQAMFGITGTSTGEMVGRGHLIVLTDGEHLKVLAGQHGARFLVMSAMPIGEPVCRYGPIVMTTPEEIDLAVNEYHEGTFVRFHEPLV